MDEAMEQRFLKVIEAKEAMLIRCPTCGCWDELISVPGVLGYVCLNLTCTTVGQTFTIKYEFER